MTTARNRVRSTRHATIRSVLEKRPDGSVVRSSTSESDAELTFSGISDEIGDISQVHPCAHSRREKTCGYFSATKVSPKYGNTLYHGFTADYVTTEPVSPGWTVDWGTGLSTFFENVAGAFPQTMSVPEYIAELKQLKRIVPDMLKAIWALPKSMRQWNASKVVANGYLAEEFGLRPLVRDVKACLTLRESVRQHLEDVKKRDCQWTYVRAKAPITASVECPPLPTTGYGAYPASARVSTARATLGALAYGRALADSAVIARSYLTALGLGNPIALAWELIPFSFVADWFLPIGRALANDDLSRPLRANLMNTQIRDTCHSVKVVYDVTYDARWVSDSNWAPIDSRMSSIMTEKFTSYSRTPGLPVGGYSLPKGLDLRKGALTLALIRQRMS